jgi:hypothetical protein
MPTRPTGVTDTAPATGVLEADVVERASPDLTTTTTADPGTGGTTLAVTSASRFPSTNNFKIDVIGTSGIAERMLVTAGAGTVSWTVTRAQDFTTAVAHSVGAKVAYVVGVQRVEPVDASRQVSCKCWAATFRTPGRAGTAGQKLFALHNATGSPSIVDVHRLTVDLVSTLVKAVTVLPPVIRIYRYTAVPTNGAALTKNLEDTALSSRTAVTAWGDASADGTSAGTALTIAAITLGTQTGLLAQEFASRFMGGAGTNPQSEIADKMTFFEGEDEFITLRALEGIAVFADYSVAAQNATSDMWAVSCRWVEQTPA